MKGVTAALENRVALVTGGTRGLGLAIARKFASEGAQVLVAGRDLTQARDLADELPHRSRGELLDLRSPTSIEALARRVASDPGRLDILVNNGGVLIDRDARPSDIARDALEATLAVNLVGTIQLTRALLPLIRRSDWGRIINVSSAWGRISGPPEDGVSAPSYRISKAALNAYTRLLAAELEGTEILVNALDPGWVRTDMGGPEAPTSPEDAALSALHLALLPDGGATGKFFHEGKEVDF